MSNQSSYLFAFYAIFIAMLFVIFIRAEGIKSGSKENTEYSTKLSTASHSAVQALEVKTLGKNVLWADANNRKETVNTFYYTLAESILNSTQDNDIQISTPIVLLIDMDGYYIGYNALFNLDNIQARPYETKMETLDKFKDNLQISSINTWGEEKYGYHIQYSLTDMVNVTTATGKTYKGVRYDVASKMTKDGISGDIISYLDGTKLLYSSSGELLGEEFTLSKTDFIVARTEETLARYINEYNYNAGNNAGGYDLTMPDISGETWHRLLQNPTFIAFLQGHNKRTGKEVINTYAYAGGEVIKSDQYFITSQMINGEVHRTYHSLNECQKNNWIKTYNTKIQFNDHQAVDETETGDTWAGKEINMTYPSMADCAAQGAYPCPICIR